VKSGILPKTAVKRYFFPREIHVRWAVAIRRSTESADMCYMVSWLSRNTPMSRAVSTAAIDDNWTFMSL